MSRQEPWWKNGVRFECQGSGKCCVSHGEYGNVYFTLADRRRLAKVLNLSTAQLTRKYLEREGSKKNFVYRLRDFGSKDCVFLKDRRCTVYEGRPEQCRVWPFWPEVMSAKTWKKEVAGFCPGIGKGKLISGKEIERRLNEHQDWEERLVERPR